MLEKLNELTEGHGALKRGHGLISGVIALSLAILCSRRARLPFPRNT